MDFEVAEGKVEISRISSLVQHFPVDDPTFVHETIDYADLAAEINKQNRKRQRDAFKVINLTYLVFEEET